MVVKLAHKYRSEDGHKLLAAASHAPKLHYCHFEASVGMWVMVMHYVRSTEVTDILTKPMHIASLRAVVTKLHDHGLVFDHPAHAKSVDLGGGRNAG